MLCPTAPYVSLYVELAGYAGAHREACNFADSTKKTATYARTRLPALHNARFGV